MSDHFSFTLWYRARHSETSSSGKNIDKRKEISGEDNFREIVGKSEIVS